MSHAFININQAGVIICLVPEYRFSNLFKDFCSAIEVDYGFVIGKGVPGGFEININDLDDILMLTQTKKYEI